jgi:hypothetical protein
MIRYLNRDSLFFRTQYPGSPFGFLPTDISGLIGWYKADSISGVSVDNTGVSSWTDSSPSGKNATNATSGSQPAYKTNRINGYPCVRFDGTNDYLQITSASFTSGSTIFLVCSASSAVLSGNNGMLCAATTGNDYDTGDSFILTTGYISANNPSGWNTGWRGIGTTNVTTAFRNWYYWTYQVSVSGSNVTQVSRKSGTQIETKTGAASGNCSPTKIMIGGRVTAGAIGTDGFYNGDIAEILIYNTDIGSANITLVEDYLSRKYAL